LKKKGKKEHQNSREIENQLLAITKKKIILTQKNAMHILLPNALQTKVNYLD